MSADTAALALIIVAAVGQNLLLAGLLLTTRWRKSSVGRALFTECLGLTLLLNISLMYHWLGDNYALRDVVRLSVYTLIAAAPWLWVWALVAEKRADRRAAADRLKESE